MKKYILVIFCICLLACGDKQMLSDEDLFEIKSAVEQQMKDYPVSTLKDVYKNFFQDSFGPGHLMSDQPDAVERMADYLCSECEQAKLDVDPSPYYVKTGWRGNFYRVNLSVINDGMVPFDTFLLAFIESAESFSLPRVEDWSREWAEIERIYRSCGFADSGYDTDSAAIQALLAGGGYASHHSRAYEEAYHPHYRLIEKNIFEERLLPLIQDAVGMEM